MVNILFSSLVSKFLWGFAEPLAKLGFGWLTKKINTWENNQLQSGLYLMDKPNVFVNGLYDKNPYLAITLNLWSSITTKLYTHRIIGKIRTKGFETELKWDKEGVPIYTHIICDIEQNKNNWMFHVPIPLEVLKSNSSSMWSIDFKAIFQHDASKTFKDIKFNIK